MKLKLLLALSVLIVTHIGTVNADIQPVPKFEKGDVVVFVGDSITHGGSYHKDIFLFHATRYPNKQFKYYNAGISGDTAAGTIKRFADDVAIHSPNKSTIMLGMNDVGGHLYQAVPSTDMDRNKWLKQQTVIRETYLSNMQTLTDSLTKINSEIVYLTPSIYDQTVKVETANNFGRNDELAVYAKAINNMAAQNNASVVDFQTPMLAINKKWQKLDPSRTIVSNDRVHPKENGHFLMAYSFLKAQGEKGKVADLALDVKNQSITKMRNCEASGQVQMTSTSLSFSCKPLALPFPLNSEQISMLSEIPFSQEMNRLDFKVTGLSEGYYSLIIDNKIVGQFDEKQLSNGLDLARNTLTPMYQQALKVKALNDERAKASLILRGIKHVQFTMLSKYPNTNLEDLIEVEQVLTKHLTLSVGKPWHGYLTGLVNDYLKFVDDEANIKQKIETLFDKIYQANQTQTHVWQLNRVNN